MEVIATKFVKMSRRTEQNLNKTILTYEGISISESDLECLSAREYINDNIINFWLKYMSRTLLTDAQQKRILIYDSHFMAALEKMDSERTHRWLRKIKLFDKDFMIIPVMEDEHWFLMTLEHPNNAYNQNVDRRFRTRVRFWDSMGHDYLKKKKKQLCQILFKFLRNAFLYEKSESIADIHNIETVYEDVRLQKNLFDCGLHLLLNAEDFICESFDVLRHVDPPEDDEWIILLNRKRNKRGSIRRLIRRLGQSQMLAEEQDDDAVELIS